MVSTTLTTIISQTSIAEANGGSQHSSYNNNNSNSNRNNNSSNNSGSGANQHHFQVIQQQQQQHQSSSYHYNNPQSAATALATSNQRNTISSHCNSPTLNSAGGTDVAPPPADESTTSEFSSTYNGAGGVGRGLGGVKRGTTLISGLNYNNSIPSSSVAAAITEKSRCIAINKTATAKPDLLTPTTKSTRSDVNVLGPLQTTSSLLSSPPPLSEQISLLFPKCRPKNGDVNSNNCYLNSDTVLKSSTVTSDSAKSPSTELAGGLPSVGSCSNFTSSIVKSLNLITQSPPPPSTPSPSSESLSSVTPRISTNPFLYPNLEIPNGESGITAKFDDQEQQQHQQQHESLSRPYPPYFYHPSPTITETNDSGSHQTHHRYEMPRKRSNYNSSQHHYQLSSATATSGFLATNYHLPSVNGNSSSNAHNANSNQSTTNQNQNQNPFIKDDCWETQNVATPAATNTVLNSPEFAGLEIDTRRPYENHHFNHYLHRQPHHIRVGRSPVDHSDLAMTSSSSSQQQKQKETESKIEPKVDNQQMDRTITYYHRSQYADKIPINHEIEWKRNRKIARELEKDRERIKELDRGRERESAEKEHQHQRHDLQHHTEDNRDDRINDDERQRGMTVITDGEVVVFDDITENWQKLRVTTDTSSHIQHPSMKLSGVKIENFEINNCDAEDTYDDDDDDDNDRHNRYLNEKFAINVDARHGIIEYEGSPRRIGQGTVHDDDTMQPYAQKVSQNFVSSPQQTMYPARPGFPQRITSPRREPCPSPMMMMQLNYKQQQQSPASNAEDTSNDVSEIGTLSDLTASEVTTSLAATTDSIAPTATTTKQTQSVIGPTTAIGTPTSATKSSTFDYLYEFSETRKVLEEFFKCPSNDEKPIGNGSDIDSVDIQYEFHSNLERGNEDEEEDDDDVDADGDADADADADADEDDDDEQQHRHQPRQQQQQQPHQQTLNHLQVNHRQGQQIKQNQQQQHQQQQQQQRQNIRSFSGRLGGGGVGGNQRLVNSPLTRDFDFFLDSASRSSGEQIELHDNINHNQVETRTNYHYSPETTDYDSNCGDLDSLSGELNGVSTSCSNYAKYYASSMPVLEDGLSSGHTSDTENNNNLNNIIQQQSSGIQHATIGSSGISMLMDMKRGFTESNNLDVKGKSIAMDTYIGMTPTNGVNDTSASRESSVRSRQDQRDHELLGQSPSSNGNSRVFKNIDPELDSLYSISVFHRPDRMQVTPPPPAPAPHRKPNLLCTDSLDSVAHSTFKDLRSLVSSTSPSSMIMPTATITAATTTSSSLSASTTNLTNRTKAHILSNALGQQQQQLQQQQQQQTLRPAEIQLPPTIPERTNNNTNTSTPSLMNSPVWVPRHLDTSLTKSMLDSSSGNHSKNVSADEEDVDTDLETDRLLGHQRLDDQGFYDDNKTLSWDRKPRSLLATSLSKFSPKVQQQNMKNNNNSSLMRPGGGFNSILPTTPEIPPAVQQKNSTTSAAAATTSAVSTTATTTVTTTKKLLDISGSLSSSEEHSEKSPAKSIDVQDCVATMDSSPGGGSGESGCGNHKKDHTTNSAKDIGGGNGGGSGSTGGNSSNAGGSGLGLGGNTTSSSTGEKKVKKSKNKEAGAVLIEGVLFRARYLGSTQLVCEGQPTKSTRMMQAEEAVSRIKAPDGDAQPSTEVDLFISTEKIMVLNTDLKEIMMDHALRTISYIADIGDLVVLMARRRFVPQDIDDGPKPNRTPKMICHVFESDEAQFIAQSIGQAFQVAYMEFLKANGIEDHSFVKEMDYQEVLNSQEIFGDELEIFAKKELQKEVVVPKAKGEILGVVIVESGWGSMLPTVVIANLMSAGAAARCGQLNIGDQLIAINGLSLVGLPLSTCQTYIKNTKNQTVVKFTVVPCAPVVEVKIKRPNTKYQLGFSVQNGVICSLLRGGIAERGGVRVGHRIIEINNQSVVAVPHEKIVNLLATSVGEILMKTMPTSMFRLLTGQENPIYI